MEIVYTGGLVFPGTSWFNWLQDRKKKVRGACLLVKRVVDGGLGAAAQQVCRGCVGECVYVCVVVPGQRTRCACACGGGTTTCEEGNGVRQWARQG